MINIQIHLEDNLKNKINKVKLYRISRLIQDDIYSYVKNISIFKFPIIKTDITRILDNYKVNYNIDYIYDKLKDKVIIKIENSMLIEINFKYDKEYSI